MRMIVDGETFEVRERPEQPGQYDCDWVTGPNSGYGFTCAFMRSQLVDTEPVPADLRADLERAIRDFLGAIDPETGYMAD
jgi:hypothetical protein